MLPEPGSRDSSLVVSHPAVWEETRQTEKAEDQGERWMLWLRSGQPGVPVQDMVGLLEERDPCMVEG